jgi:hypothetical protein
MNNFNNNYYISTNITIILIAKLFYYLYTIYSKLIPNQHFITITIPTNI